MRHVLIITATVLATFTYVIFAKGLHPSWASAQGLSASFVWQGMGSDLISARLSQSNYSGTRPALVTFGVYWCKKSGSAPCAPDFTGDNKSAETLIFQDLNLSVPTGNNSLNVVLPTISTLAQKTCGRFQVDLGFKNGGGIIGGQVFTIVGDCTVEMVQMACPYLSTQAQVQKDGSDPWDDSKSIVLGQSVNLGGFHNGTGRFAGDPVNNYSPNIANVDFVFTEPGGAASFTLTGAYPIRFTPTKSGTYSFSGRTRKEAGNGAGGYYNESACTDIGFIMVAGQSSLALIPSPTPAAVVRVANPTPSATPLPTPTPTTGATPIPTPASTSETNVGPECVNLSATPAVGGAQLTTTLMGKGRDRDGIIKRMEINFGDDKTQSIDINNGETNRETSISVSHICTQPGEYNASLRVKDNSGQGNEWSSTPDSCKVHISVQGQVLGAVSIPKNLPKSGISEWLTLGYVIAGSLGIGLKLWAKKLKNI